MRQMRTYHEGLRRVHRRQCIFAPRHNTQTDDRYPGHNCTSKMANVRGLLVLSLVCLLLFQMMSPSRACVKTSKCESEKCGVYSCASGATCNYSTCNCWDPNNPIKRGALERQKSTRKRRVLRTTTQRTASTNMT
ncbi:hypothetical protein LSAT2_009018 [Lamellibrachia satsuma]|nr:hypothetical protein LSAT2_009018 [Lamellibrachia satsuma]